MVRTLAVLALLVACAPSPTVPRMPLRPTFVDKRGGPVIVLGAVTRPTVVPWWPGMSIRYAIRAAGGATAFAMRRAVVRRRWHVGQIRTLTVPYDGLPEIELAPGDVVHVRERH